MLIARDINWSPSLLPAAGGQGRPRCRGEAERGGRDGGGRGGGRDVKQLGGPSRRENEVSFWARNDLYSAPVPSINCSASEPWDSTRRITVTLPINCLIPKIPTWNALCFCPYLPKARPEVTREIWWKLSLQKMFVRVILWSALSSSAWWV